MTEHTINRAAAVATDQAIGQIEPSHACDGLEEASCLLWVSRPAKLRVCRTTPLCPQ